MIRKVTRRSIWTSARLTGVAALVLASGWWTVANSPQAQASNGYMSSAQSTYPTIVGTSLDSCTLCHTGSIPSLNAYGSAFKSYSHSFAAIESLDSDGDGYTNLVEINARTFPGNSSSKPTAAPTATATRIPPTATRTSTSVAPTATATRVQPTPTLTGTSVPPSTATLVPPTVAPSMTPGSGTVLTLNPVADTYVYQSSPSVNYGTSTQLRTDGSPITNGFLRFTVSGLTTPVTKATLRIYANSSLSGGLAVRSVANTTWSESTTTYSNAPALGSIIASSGAVNTGTWLSFNVTSYVKGNGTFSFGLTNSNITALSLASRESSNRPQLIITTGSPASTATPPPTQVPPTATPIPPTATPVVNPSYQPAAPIRAAFFYPWFAEAWTQQGIYPYTNYHPSLGYYESHDDVTIDKQITLAAQAHLDAFIGSWWGQGDDTDLDLQHILARSERSGSPNPNLRWAIYYENESQGDPSATQILSDLQYLSTRAFNHPGYLKVNGKPVIFVYAWTNDACGMADRWAQAKASFGSNIYVVLKVFPGYLNCANQPDSWHQYSPAVGYDVQGKLSAVASPGFWLKGNAVRLARDAVRFESDVKKLVASGAFWQLITTWNEWGEGTSVEPATEWGNTYIDILTRNLPAR